MSERQRRFGLDALCEQDAELAQHLAAEPATAPDSADLEGVADQLEHTIAKADTRQGKPSSG